MATTRRQRAAAAKLDSRVTKRGTPMESKIADKADKPAISPTVMYFLMFVLFGSTIFGLIEQLRQPRV